MASVKDGWHKVLGHDVYVENGGVTHGKRVTEDGQTLAIYPYRREDIGGDQAFWLTTGVSLSTLCRGLQTGRYSLA